MTTAINSPAAEASGVMEAQRILLEGISWDRFDVRSHMIPRLSPIPPWSEIRSFTKSGLNGQTLPDKRSGRGDLLRPARPCEPLGA